MKLIEKNLNFVGQITLEQNLGKHIKNLTERKDVKTIVDVGTFHGLGSTICIIDGMDDTKKMWSIELYPNMYKYSLINLSKYLTPNIILLNGKIIEYNDVFWFDHNTIDFSTDEHARLWYEKDMKYLKKSKNVLTELPNIIDLLVLDGGEYTTYPEYLKLKDKTNIIVLDDVIIHKCKRVREELLNDSDFELIFEDLNDRNGYSIFERTKWVTQEQ